MTSLGQGSNEATEVPVPVLAETPAACVATRVLADGTGRSQPRPSGRDKPGDIAGEPKNSGEPSVPGLADWLLATVAVLPTAVGDGQYCSCVPVVDA